MSIYSAFHIRDCTLSSLLNTYRCMQHDIDGGARRTPPTNSAGQQTAAGKYFKPRERASRI